MARPVCKGFCRDRRMISLLQRIRPRRSPPGQDGDARAPVLINSSASCAVFNTRLPERRLTVRPSRLHPLANPACTTGAFAPTERTLRGYGYRLGVKRFGAALFVCGVRLRDWNGVERLRIDFLDQCGLSLANDCLDLPVRGDGFFRSLHGLRLSLATSRRWFLTRT